MRRRRVVASAEILNIRVIVGPWINLLLWSSGMFSLKCIVCSAIDEVCEYSAIELITLWGSLDKLLDSVCEEDDSRRGTISN